MSAPAVSQMADHEILPRLAAVVSRDRATTAEMLALICAADVRGLYAAESCTSMYAYCLRVLHMSEDVAYKRIRVARAARRFPVILGEVAEGRLHLSAVLLLIPHLTWANASGLLAAATHKTRREVEQLLAERFPQQDHVAFLRPDAAAVATVQLAPGPVAPLSAPMYDGTAGPLVQSPPAAREAMDPSAPELEPGAPQAAHPPAAQAGPTPVAAPSPAVAPTLRARVTPLTAEHASVLFLFGKEACNKLSYAQALAGNTVPSGDLAEIFERALDAYILKLEKQKFAATSRPRAASGRSSVDPRHIPAAVKREVWQRDGGRCTFENESRRRCGTCERLEFDHVKPVAKGGQATTGNLRLRCRTHNQYEAEQAFGAGFMREKRKSARREAALRKTVRMHEKPRLLARDVARTSGASPTTTASQPPAASGPT